MLKKIGPDVAKKIGEIKIIPLFIIIFGIIVGIVGYLCSQSEKNDDRERDYLRCRACETGYYAGDAGGNYMNIGLTGYCNKCEEIADAYREYKDYKELN